MLHESQLLHTGKSLEYFEYLLICFNLFTDLFLLPLYMLYVVVWVCVCQFVCVYVCWLVYVCVCVCVCVRGGRENHVLDS